MNGYQIHIETYKRVLEQNRPDIDKEHIQAKIKALEPFAERTETEIIQMFDTGAFNNITKAYCKEAMKNCGVNDEIITNVISELKSLFDTIEATEIIKR